MWLILIAFFLLTLWYLVLKKKFSYWKERGVPGPEPTLVVGNLGKIFTGQKNLGEIYNEIYHNYPDLAFVGIYKLGLPCLVVRDPDFIKNITIKDFKHFQDNDYFVNDRADPVFGKNPFFLKGAEWKHKRSQIITCFTPQKMKAMFPVLDNITHKTVAYLERQSKKSGCLDSRDIAVRITSENVAACAFGIEGKCFDEGYSPFRDLSEKFLPLCTNTYIRVFMVLMFPQFSDKLGVGVATKEFESLILGIVKAAVEERKSSKQVRNDFLEYMMEIAKNSNIFKEDRELIAQAASFYIDGYETSARTLTFFLFLMAQHEDKQEILREEINRVCEKYGDKITYEGLHEMEYLDACFNENMRLYPVLSLLMKTCTERYTYTPTNPDFKKITVTVEPGQSVIFPLFGLQMDEKYFEEPEKFIPERFTEKRVQKYTFLPVGEGPRACLGIRFGAIQVKLAVAQIVRNFKMTVNEKTRLPFEFESWYFLLAPKQNTLINFERISN